MSFFGDIAKAGKSIIQSPVTAAVVGGVAIVFPPVGVPAAAAVATANAALALAEKSGATKALGALDRAAFATKKTKARLLVRARSDLAAGMPRQQVSANLRRSALKLRAAQRDKPEEARASAHKAQLTAQLRNTAALAKSGDAGARRALATFRLVSRARKGDPAARAAVSLIAQRYEVGQRVRSRFELTRHGRIRVRV